MQRDFKHLLKDCSQEDGFQFAVTCENCGKTWKSRKIPFSKMHTSPITEGKKVVYVALYEREKQEAERAALQVGERLFSRCPICGRWVCDECFMACEDLDMCEQCARKLGEKGSVVG
ncbi:hypothetical protein [Suipraeoptans intestinalis]|uniref:Uncharacterized protein n=1 Tax=Suipraeoptans intestinalis TaxID=2606628 RepID=A0A6N7V3Q2_9FIRM|nr:hypothetical protein [Suipraeoptans intestinalis]MDY3121236.1 hypothetical protein [Suipraeoptans intestinalis]MSR93792.1 hypothetical protein [Suipraeoptans intestinalis]